MPFGISCRQRLLLLALVLMTTPLPCSADDVDPLKIFVERYRCETVVRLEQIRAAKAKKNRYITLSLRASEAYYVQCIYDDDGTEMLCEAASGAYGEKSGATERITVPQKRITALEALGFKTDEPEKNFSQVAGVKSENGLVAIAELMLTALFHGYSANADSKVTYRAPYGPGGEAVRKRCIPIT